jgi:hypothetical protein
MRYIVIELEPEIRICTKDGDPIIFSNKVDAFRYASVVHKGLVYPITDTMAVFNRIRDLTRGHYSEHGLLDELTKLIDEIV